MKAYSLDLRERAVQSIASPGGLSRESGECNVRQAAERFQVSQPSLERWRARWRASGSCEPRPHGGGPVRKLAAAEKAIRAAVKEEADATLAELGEQVEKETKIHSNGSMMIRELRRLKLVRKKSRSMVRNAKPPCQPAGHAAGQA